MWLSESEVFITSKAPSRSNFHRERMLKISGFGGTLIPPCFVCAVPQVLESMIPHVVGGQVGKVGGQDLGQA